MHDLCFVLFTISKLIWNCDSFLRLRNSELNYIAISKKEKKKDKIKKLMKYSRNLLKMKQKMKKKKEILINLNLLLYTSTVKIVKAINAKATIHTLKIRYQDTIKPPPNQKKRGNIT